MTDNKQKKTVIADQRYEAAKKNFILTAIIAFCIISITLALELLDKDTPTNTVGTTAVYQLGLEHGTNLGTFHRKRNWKKSHKEDLVLLLEQEKKAKFRTYLISEKDWSAYCDGFLEGYDIGYQ